MASPFSSLSEGAAWITCNHLFLQLLYTQKKACRLPKLWLSDSGAGVESYKVAPSSCSARTRTSKEKPQIDEGQKARTIADAPDHARATEERRHALSPASKVNLLSLLPPIRSLQVTEAALQQAATKRSSITGG